MNQKVATTKDHRVLGGGGEVMGEISCMMASLSAIFMLRKLGLAAIFRIAGDRLLEELWLDGKRDRGGYLLS